MPPAYATSHAAPVPLAEICGGLLAASLVLGAPGQVAGSPTATHPGARVPSPGGLFLIKPSTLCSGCKVSANNW